LSNDGRVKRVLVQSQPEKLTPRQQRAVVGIFMVLLLAFSSVFGYAYIRGQHVWRSKEAILIAQQNRNKAFRYQHSKHTVGLNNQAKKMVGRIAQGTTRRISPTVQEFPKEIGFADGWSVLKGGHLIASNKNPKGWFVFPTGMVTIPKDALIGGGYDARCSLYEHREYYQFEVVGARTTKAPQSQ
jgi:hypothetical protein